MSMTSIWGVCAEVGGYWKNKAFNWLLQKNPVNTLLDTLSNAQTFEEWEAAAFQLDELLHTDLWRQNASSKYYDYKLMNERRRAIIKAREEEDILGLVNILRSGLVRNMGNITASKLFNRAYAGTKLLIEEYITQVALAIEYVTALSTNQSHETGWTSQTKLDLLHDTRQAFGRTTLVLQGGAMFGLCHLGVVKALHLRGLLPRIITGTGTGAYIAALVCIHTEDEMLDFLNGDGIDITTLAKRQGDFTLKENEKAPAFRHLNSSVQVLLHRMIRFVREGYIAENHMLEACARVHVGDLTFEEAYARTKRVLNVTLPTSGHGGVPNLLNYLTAPNVLIYSAALASNATPGSLHPQHILSKDESGTITPFPLSPNLAHADSPEHDPSHTPSTRIAELFNVNHFIVSTARPHLPLLLPTQHEHPSHPRQGRRSSTLLTPFLRLLSLEIHHRLHQLNSVNLLPATLRRYLIDSTVPAGTASLTIVPDLHASDIWKVLLQPPSSGTGDDDKQGIDHWILKGERSVWPSVCLLKVRCAIEVELDRCYQVVRRRKPLDAVGGGEMSQRRAIEGLGFALEGRGNGGGREEAEGVVRAGRANSVGMEHYQIL